ncbi:hypothetical protein GW17_00020032 [Ensete ventricosum]|nr:hypothetical protein GW17_00020032 [Ensete ventricosum]
MLTDFLVTINVGHEIHTKTDEASSPAGLHHRPCKVSSLTTFHGRRTFCLTVKSIDRKKGRTDAACFVPTTLLFRALDIHSSEIVGGRVIDFPITCSP